jgi:acyl-CoA thioesterase
VTGWFLLQGDTTKPFTFRIEVIREGGSYCQRQVHVTQDPTQGVCFTCICSFKRPEKSVEERQLKVDIKEKYAVVLKGKRTEDWPECPGVDSPL